MSAAILSQLRSGSLRGITRLTLSADLTALPAEVLSLADSLEVLDVSRNHLSSLPDWLPALKKLRILFCSRNPFQRVPEITGACPALEMIGLKSCQIHTLPGASLPPRLRWLILTDNLLTTLPPELGCCFRMQKLMLSGNQLASLPSELNQCRNLELLRLAANRFNAFPEWLWEMPALAWLALGGNPCTESRSLPGVPDRTIPWRDLCPGPLLGEGASGLIYRAVWTPGPPQLAQEVAVKVFRGTMTSDGLPANEIVLSLATAGEPGLVGALGRITGHPDQQEGMVMPLLDPGFRPLAGPPSLETCTRDIYPPDCRFSAPETLRLIHTIATSASHLHRNEILHGDLYAHNILHHHAEGATRLSDFGAASSYPTGVSSTIERLEVRAFGIFIQEMLERCTHPGALPPFLHALPARCLDSDVPSRPTFEDVLCLFQQLGGNSS